MKQTLLTILPLLLIVGCSKPVNEETLIDKDGLKYHPDTKELYTGKTFKNRLGGMKKSEGSYKNGKKKYGISAREKALETNKKISDIYN